MRLSSLAAAAGLVVLATTASAQDYPTGPITIVVPFAAGGPTDTVTRLVAEPMSKALGQQIVVQNVGGAGGTLGATQVAKAAPDGYTLLLHHIGMSTAPSLYPDLAYDPVKDFEPIGLVTSVPMTIIARKDFPPNTLAGAHRLREGERRHRHLRQRRHRRGQPSLRHALHVGDRHRAHHRALPGHRPGDDRPPRRPGRLHVRPDHQHHRPDPAAARSRPMPSPRPSGSPTCPTCRPTAEAGLPDFSSASGTAYTRRPAPRRRRSRSSTRR